MVPLPVCGRVEMVYDYSAWLLICISFGAPWPHHTVSVCSPRSWRHTLSNTLNINTLTLYFHSFSLTQSFTHTHPASVFIALGTREWYALNGKWQILFHILCKGNILMTHLIYSHCKLATRLQVWNELIFQSSAWYNCTQNNGKVICVALISEVHKQENTIVCLHWKHTCFLAKACA